MSFNLLRINLQEQVSNKIILSGVLLCLSFEHTPADMRREMFQPMN